MSNDDIYGGNKKLKQQTIEKIIDHETGETKETKEVNVFNANKEPPFVKLYLADLLYFKDMPRGLNPILHVLLKNIQWGNNLLVLNASIKRRMAEEVGLKVGTIEKAITQFVQAEILIREDKGIYKFNPFLFGCGYWDDIQQIRLEVNYSLSGRTFQTAIKRTGPKEDSGTAKKVFGGGDD